MIREGFENILDAPWLSVWPGLAILVLVLGLNMIGDGLRDATDPRLRSEKRESPIVEHGSENDEIVGMGGAGILRANRLHGKRCAQTAGQRKQSNCQAHKN